MKHSGESPALLGPYDELSGDDNQVKAVLRRRLFIETAIIACAGSVVGGTSS